MIRCLQVTSSNKAKIEMAKNTSRYDFFAIWYWFILLFGYLQNFKRFSYQILKSLQICKWIFFAIPSFVIIKELASDAKELKSNTTYLKINRNKTLNIWSNLPFGKYFAYPSCHSWPRAQSKAHVLTFIRNGKKELCIWGKTCTAVLRSFASLDWLRKDMQHLEYT